MNDLGSVISERWFQKKVLLKGFLAAQKPNHLFLWKLCLHFFYTQMKSKNDDDYYYHYFHFGQVTQPQNV